MQKVIGIGLNDSSSRLEETFLLQEKIENVCLHNEARRHSKRNLKEKVCNQSDWTLILTFYARNLCMNENTLF